MQVDKALPRPRLSVAMIVRNEHDVLAETLDSVRPIADEIVVLDTGSTDQTVAVARQGGAFVEEHPWCNDFSAARNHALSLVTGDWILWLDAGERLTAESALSLRRFVDGQPERCQVYGLWIELPTRDRAGSAEQILQPRLMPGGSALRFEGRVRESLLPAIQAAGMSIAAAPGRILRHPRQHDPARRQERARRNLRLGLEEAKQRGESPPRLLLVAGEAYSALGIQEKARVVFREAIRTAPQGSSEMLEAFHGLLTTFDGDARHGDVQLATGVEALEIFPRDVSLLLAMGNYLLARQRTDLAIRSFESAVRAGQVTPEVWHLTAVKELAAICLSLALQCEHRDAEACQVLEQALNDYGVSIAGNGDMHPASCGTSTSHLEHPEAGPCFRMEPDSEDLQASAIAEVSASRTVQVLHLQDHLLNLYVKLGETEQALALADRMPSAAQERELFRDVVRGACEAARQNWLPALGFLQSAYVSGCRSAFCLRWLAVTLLSNGEVEAARPVLEEWHRLEPDDAELRAYLAALSAGDESGATFAEGGGILQSQGSSGLRFRIDAAEDATEGIPPPAPASPRGLDIQHNQH